MITGYLALLCLLFLILVHSSKLIIIESKHWLRFLSKILIKVIFFNSTAPPRGPNSGDRMHRMHLMFNFLVLATRGW